MTKNKNRYWYDFEDDLKKYPGAWCYIIVGGRECGKTFSTLKYHAINKIHFTFLKRTGDDIDLLCAGSGRVGTKENEYGVDLSPFKSINREIHTDIRANSIKKGLGGFWHYEEGEITGAPIGYLLALNYVTKFKGFDLSECDSIIFDEFIPNPWDRINRKEGEQLMDLYKTIDRGRTHRGKGQLKLICLANAVSISNPVMNILEITDDVAAMQLKGQEYLYLEHRGILIHIVQDSADFAQNQKKTGVYEAMKDTAWGRMAFDNEFAYNDFSAVGKQRLKGYKPYCTISYKNDTFYIWFKEDSYYMCKSSHQSDEVYNLNRENDQKAFFNEYVYELRQATIENHMTFENYSMYDLIVNYRNFFKI